jgi:hypothetical protein
MMRPYSGQNPMGLIVQLLIIEDNPSTLKMLAFLLEN